MLLTTELTLTKNAEAFFSGYSERYAAQRNIVLINELLEIRNQMLRSS